MKKLLTVILTGGIVFSLSASGQNMATGSKMGTKNTLRVSQGENRLTKKLAEGFTFADESIDGGWNRAKSPVITNNIRRLADKATENLVGAEYTPVAYIGDQVVAGTNHCILCKIATITPGAVETYAIVYLYEDLEGNVEITDIVGSDAEIAATCETGGWNETESPNITKDARAALEKAIEGLTGASYTPVAYLANQAVAGTNYSILCEVSAVYPGAEAVYSIVHVYRDLEGNAKITEMFDFTPAND